MTGPTTVRDPTADGRGSLGETRLYHFTDDPNLIRTNGFPLTTVPGINGSPLSGVLVHGSAAVDHQGLGEYVLELRLAGQVSLERWVVVAPGLGWAWCVPEEFLSSRAQVRLLHPEEIVLLREGYDAASGVRPPRPGALPAASRDAAGSITEEAT